MLAFKNEQYEKNHSSRFYLGVNLSPLMVAAVLGFFILLFFRFLPTQIPLFYSLSWGDKQLVTHRQFFLIPAIITLITLLNLIISWQLHNLQSFFKKVLLFASFITTLILTITFIKIVLIFI